MYIGLDVLEINKRIPPCLIINSFLFISKRGSCYHRVTDSFLNFLLLR